MHVQQQHSCCVDAVALHSDGRRECLMHKWEIENSAGRLKTQPRVCGDCALLLRVVVRPLMQMQSNGYTFTFRWSREQTAASGESGGIRTGQKKTKHPYPVTAADSAMSIVAESEFGWLLDHLAHVNSAVESTAEADSLASGLRFNAQYFHQPRPHIAAGASADTVECGERQVEDGGDGTLALLGSTAKRKRKRKRNDMNQGEIDALAYHQTIRDFVLEGSRNLVDLGRQRNLLLPRTLIPGPVEPPSPRRHCPGTDYVPAEEHEPRHGTQRNHRLAPAAETPNVKESGGAAAPSSRAGCRDVCCRACRDGAVAAEPDPLAELCDADEAVGRGRLPERASDVLVLEDTGAGTTELTAKTAVGRVVENRRRGPSVVDFNGHEYVLPPRCSFLLSDVARLEPLLQYGTFDLIVLDPPWENKSVKRSKRYRALPEWQIARLPVPALASPGCLVLTWVTNRQRLLQFVKRELYPSWRVSDAVEWHWVKMSGKGRVGNLQQQYGKR
ncbi:N(6)-adenine-specific methyltransferase METTL4 isoform X3 [Petromyzon marinus]|uniref:N(6)-adenine-specific methyltransferase METTL4 isoform X3 n=1 Tax=Petromyzon marinus TaxID=7757 RepID=UPI003F6F6619